MKWTDMFEGLNDEIQRRTRALRIFPNVESCLRMIRALRVGTHEARPEGRRQLTMDGPLAEQKMALMGSAHETEKIVR